MKEQQAQIDLDVMMDAIKRDAPSYFRMGAMRAKKKLANGAVVTVSIRMPVKRTAKKKASDHS